MKKLLLAAVAVGAISSGIGITQAADQLVLNRNAAIPFATLPDGVRFPEGITADPATGDIFVATFDFGPNANKLVRFSKNGHLSAIRDFGGTPLLGLDFDAARGKVYILNFGASKVQRIAADFDATTAVEDVATLPSIGAPGPRTVGNPDGSNDTITFGSNGFPAPNAMTFSRNGSLYVSDSFQGAIFRIDNVATCAKPCVVTTVVHDPLLATAGFPPFGANGLVFNKAQDALFVANTANDSIVRIYFNKVLDGTSIQVNPGGQFCYVTSSGTDRAVTVTAVDDTGQTIQNFTASVCYDPSGPDLVIQEASQTCAGLEPLGTTLQHKWVYTVAAKDLKDHDGNSLSFTVNVRVADTQATAASLGWRPVTSLEDGLSRTVDWYRQRLAEGAFAV